MAKTRLLLRDRVRRGQTIVIVALSALVLLGLVALAVDGGSALVQRRNMQNAADAAALAAAQLLQSNMTTSCTNIGPIPCYPAYLLTKQDVLNRVQQLTTANGAQNYTLEYHFNTCQSPPCYAAPPGPATDPLPPLSPGNPWIDGVRVTASVSATTTFAQAINIPYIPVSAVSAARLYPTCVPTDLHGAVLPLTRYRPALETELAGSQGVRNDLCHPLKLWDWHPGATDVPVGDFSNVISFNATQFHNNPLTFTGLDGRNGPPPPAPPNGGLGDYIPDSGGPPTATCNFPLDPCAYMDGSADHSRDSNDIMDWIFWQWGLAPSGGVISTTHEWDPTTNTHSTWYPANRANQGGTNGGACCMRPGDWTDVYQTSDIVVATNDYIQDAVADVAHYKPTTTLSGMNWGKGIDVNMYLWGLSLSDYNTGGDDDKSAQIWLDNVPNPNDDPNCGIDPNPPCNPYTGWEDLTVAGAYGTYAVSTAYSTLPPAPQINRVRLTRAVRVRLYENLNSEGGVLSSYCPTLPNMGDPANYNTVWGYVMNIPQPGPTDAALCPAPGTWMPGGGVYSRLIDPDAP
jgi:hypothetical protein